MNKSNLNKELIEYLKGFMTESRFERFSAVLNQRTRHITIALENIFQSHNASAVLRTCDCFGIQDVHIIESEYKYEVNDEIALGSSKWLNLNKYHSSLECINTLKSNGYKIIAMSPHAETGIENYPLGCKTALFFGTELHGLNTDTIQHADGLIKIPMFGFTESFNISVSAAIVLYEFTRRLRSSETAWHLPEEQKQSIILEWLKTTVKGSDLMIKNFIKSKNNNL